MIDAIRPHNKKAVELFNEYLPNWLATMVIEAHIKSCIYNEEWLKNEPKNLKDAFSLNVHWEILDLSLIDRYTIENSMRASKNQLLQWYGHLLEKKDTHEACECGRNSIQLSADAIKYFNRIAEVEKDRNAIVISRPWLIIGLIASMIFGCSILGAAFYILISHLIY